MATATFTPLQDPSSAQKHIEYPRPRSPKRNVRHTKGLSLNFPILLPSQHGSRSSSPRATSPVGQSARNSPHVKADSFPTNQSTQSPTRNGADILTLVAAQERRVLEIREELAKAETELTDLKKQWALYEANKKRDEARQVRNVPTPLDEVPSPMNDEEIEEDRRRRRALVEMSHNAGNQASSVGGKLGRKGSQRVFEGRHTRALSLLSPTAQKQIQSIPGTSIDELLETVEARTSEDAASEQTPMPSVSRMPTLDGFISPDSLQSFGKTYKDLAAHRRSLPPVAADMFMKSGKQVVDGVREGLWTFFEDIRQATVGDEAINGPSRQQRQRKQSRDPHKLARTKNKPRMTVLHDEAAKDTSFWNEFGLETPKRPTESPSKDIRNGHVQQKSSTDSQNPPDLLEDTNGNDEDWDNWESPVSTRQDTKAAESQPQLGEELPWPELKKLTPSKLSRTASDLMREWHDDAGQSQ